MALGGDDAQTALRHDLVVIQLPLGTQGLLLLCVLIGGDGRIGLHRRNHFFKVAAQHNVGATARHVGGNGDHLAAPSLGHDVGFALVLFGVEHLVRQLGLGQQGGDDFRVFNRARAHQNRLAALVAIADVINGGGVFFLGGFVHPIELVFAPADAVGRDDHGFQTVNLLKFVGLGIGRPGHPREFAVQAEIVLKGDGRQGLVFGLDVHTLFGLNRLVQAIAPTPPRHQAPGELVDDDDLAVLVHIVLIAVVEVVRTQSSGQVVHQTDVGRVVQRRAFGQHAHLHQQALRIFMALFGEEHLV